jgi:hypothetical protein
VVPKGAGYGALMTHFDTEAGGRRSLPSWASRLASMSAIVALALIVAPVAKADVAELFNLSGSFNSSLYPLSPLVPFTGTVDLDFSSDFAVETLTSINISVLGHPSVFNQNVSLSITPSLGIIGASNSVGDTLELLFAAPQSGTWAGFDAGDVSFGYVVFSGASGILLGATGEVTRDGPVILAPPIIVPPAVPELSTWAMMLVGLAGLGLAAKGRRALGFLGGKA